MPVNPRYVIYPKKKSERDARKLNPRAPVTEWAVAETPADLPLDLREAPQDGE